MAKRDKNSEWYNLLVNSCELTGGEADPPGDGGARYGKRRAAKNQIELPLTKNTLPDAGGELSETSPFSDVQRLLMSIPISMGIVVDRVFRWINPRMCAYTGYAELEIVGHDPRMLYPGGEEPERVEPITYDSALKNGNGRVTTRWVHKDGTILHLVLYMFPIDPNDCDSGTAFTAIDIGDRIDIEKELASTHEKLERERRALHKKNIVLHELMNTIEEEKMIVRGQVAQIVDQVLTPALKKLVCADGTINTYYYTVLDEGLREMADASGGIIRQYSKLSPREMEVCAMIRQGISSKEIANLLYISPGTVKRHREAIRRKLGISKKEVNLSNYLRNLSVQE